MSETDEQNAANGGQQLSLNLVPITRNLYTVVERFGSVVIFALCSGDEEVVPEPRINSTSCGSPPISPQVSLARIVGGVEARRHSWPWQCSVRLTIAGQVYHICGASILDQRYVVSAAHCV